MTRRSFFVESPCTVGGNVVLKGDTARHIRQILRLNRGHKIELRDGKGSAWTAEIESVGRGEVQVRILSEIVVNTDPRVAITLAVAYARADRMDLVLRQAVELGVSRFAAFRADRSQYQLSSRQRQKRRDRWLKISREALCQCGRTLLPEIMLLPSVGSLLEWVETLERGDRQALKIVALEKEKQRGLAGLHGEIPGADEIVLAVGCEGGWSSDEAALFERAGFWAVHLGPRILRLETAAVAALSAVQLLWGDMGEVLGVGF